MRLLLLYLACALPLVGCAAAAQGLTVRAVQATTWEAVADRCASRLELAPSATGHLVVLELDGGVYRLFVSGERSVLCATETPSAQATGDPQLHELTLRAVADLAARLSPTNSAIEIRRTERVVWRDSSAGCPRPGEAYSQMLTEGARVILRADGRTFHYHQVAGGDPFPCASPSPIEPLPAAEHQ